MSISMQKMTVNLTGNL